MTWTFIGLIVGFVLTLTGSGGGLVSIPLFILLANFDLKTATVFSLIAVSVGAILGWYPKRKNTFYFYSVLLFLFSFPGSLIGKKIKIILPEIYISILLSLICLFALYSFWSQKNKNSLHSVGENKIKLKEFGTVSLFGFLLGVLTTTTGIGGGVMLVPILVGPLQLTLSHAIATSLFAVSISSLVSLLIQYETLIEIFKFNQFLQLVLGILIAVFIATKLTHKISAKSLLLTQKITFSIVVCFTILGVFLKGS